LSKIKYSLDELKFISVAESLTHARIKDCIITDSVLFIVHENEMGKALGKKAVNIDRLERILNKKVKFAEFRNDVAQFIVNLLYPLRIKNVELQDKIAIIHADDMKTKGLIIGRDRRNVTHLRDVVSRFFAIEEIKVP